MTSMQDRARRRAQDRPTAPHAGAHPVALHVVRRVARFVDDDRQSLAEVLAVLSPAQRSGAAALPDPLPATPAVRAAVAATGPSALDAEARRALLAAAVLVTDRLDVLLGATQLSVDRLLAPPLADRLILADGRFRLADPRLRAVVHADADLAERTRTHAALAAELVRVGEPRAGCWHSALATLAGDPALAEGLVGLAEDRLARGGAEAAHAVAREAASHGAGQVRARAFLVAGRGALFSGHLHDAAAWLDRVTSTGVADVRDDAERALEAVESLASPERQTDGPPGVCLARLVVPVARAAASAVDRAVLAAVVEALARVDLDPREADAVVARALVTAVPAAEPGAWDTRAETLSPLAEAHLRVLQALVLLRGGDGARAGEVLADAAGRLPVADVAGGLGGVVARCAVAAGPSTDGLAAVLRAVGPDPVPAALAVCRHRREPPAPAGGPGRSLVVDAVRACVPRPGPGRDDEDVWARWSGVLTARELDVARLVAEGMANKQVADRLCVSVRTVEVHLGRVFRKVGVGSRGELTVRVLTGSS